MTSRNRRLFVLAALTAALLGCGQKGPLYLPEPEPAPPPAHSQVPAPPERPADTPPRAEEAD